MKTKHIEKRLVKHEMKTITCNMNVTKGTCKPHTLNQMYEPTKLEIVMNQLYKPTNLEIVIQ